MIYYTSRVKVLVFVLLFIIPNIISATDFETLINNGKISYTCNGNDESVHYARPLKIVLQNNSSFAINVSLPAGYVFRADDSTYQNILITNSMLAALQPGQSKTYVLNGMCMESSDRAPQSESTFSSNGMAENKLVKLAEYIEKNKFFSQAGQNAVWTLINDKPLYEVTSLDTSQAYKLQHFLSDLTGKAILPAPEEEAYLYDYSERPRKVVVGGEIVFNTSSVMEVEWSLFNEDGILLREIYNGPIGPGEVTLDFEYDAEVYSDPIYYLKLVADGELMYNRKLAFDR